MTDDPVQITKIVVGLLIAIAVALPLAYCVYALIMKYDKPMCRVCQKSDKVTKYNYLPQDDQEKVIETYKWKGIEIENVHETALCDRCKVIIDELFDDQGVICRKCGTPMYPIDLNERDPNALYCRPCSGILTIIECPSTKIRMSWIDIKTKTAAPNESVT